MKLSLFLSLKPDRFRRSPLTLFVSSPSLVRSPSTSLSSMNTFANGLTGKAVSWATEMVRRGRFELLIKKFKRTYADAAEKERRFAIFCKNVDFINKCRAEKRMVKGPRSRVGLNTFFDMTHEEIVGNYCRRVVRSSANEVRANELGKSTQFPSEVGATSGQEIQKKKLCLLCRQPLQNIGPDGAVAVE
ncbi:uncharacterized protein LOC109707121 isoform X2 [Ananas comosus]|uniref:Uncharacterized protein LOC109707121 isoform X2 n=1 Tax=Ananas comosus TaxID=4615 RepID=A0A6P5EK71_ANACO|nr:uncharacterized protein LOC109707121 isoform X2 [Ananas comosus]